MIKYKYFILILLITCSSACTNQPIPPTQPKHLEPVSLVRVIDGDTLVTATNKGHEVIRLLLIDSPESVHPDKPSQPFANEATQFVKDIIDQSTYLFLERGSPEHDIYGRTLGYLWYKDPDDTYNNLNFKIVKEGFAYVNLFDDSNAKYLDNLYQAENYAQKKKLNIWSIDNYVTDYGFNHQLSP